MPKQVTISSDFRGHRSNTQQPPTYKPLFVVAAGGTNLHVVTSVEESLSFIHHLAARAVLRELKSLSETQLDTPAETDQKDQTNHNN